MARSPFIQEETGNSHEQNEQERERERGGEEEEGREEDRKGGGEERRQTARPRREGTDPPDSGWCLGPRSQDKLFGNMLSALQRLSKGEAMPVGRGKGAGSWEHVFNPCLV